MVPKAANHSVVESLRDGRRLEIRALRPDDRHDFLAAVGQVGTQSLYQRFFAVKRHFTENETAFFLNIDFVSHVALVAILEENGKATIAGGARYVVVNPKQAEVAFTVVDQYQRLGIGATLMRHIIIIAREAGLHELVAQVLVTNAAMLRVFERSGFRCSMKRESSTISLTLHLLSQSTPVSTAP
jgi:RimJ/RimL family protein N-acetyltransferase